MDRGGTRRLGARAAIVVTLVAALLLISVPATAEGNQGRYTNPCVGFGLNPPGVGVGECFPGVGSLAGASSEGAPSVNATAHGLDVLAQWEVDTAELNGTLEGFQVYRGTQPWVMHHVADTGPGERSHLDEGAVASGQAAWYAVGAVVDGEVIFSEPVLVDGVYVE